VDEIASTSTVHRRRWISCKLLFSEKLRSDSVTIHNEFRICLGFQANYCKQFLCKRL